MPSYLYRIGFSIYSIYVRLVWYACLLHSPITHHKEHEFRRNITIIRTISFKILLKTIKTIRTTAGPGSTRAFHLLGSYRFSAMMHSSLYWCGARFASTQRWNKNKRNKIETISLSPFNSSRVSESSIATDFVAVDIN